MKNVLLDCSLVGLYLGGRNELNVNSGKLEFVLSQKLLCSGDQLIMAILYYPVIITAKTQYWLLEI